MIATAKKSRIEKKPTSVSMDVKTNVCFEIVGGDDVFHGQSKTLSTKNLSFYTNHSLKMGMLLQMTMGAKQPNSPLLQTMVEVSSIKPIDGSNSYYYHIDGDIKDIAIET